MNETIGIVLVLLMAAFVLVAVFYFRRQAKALDYMAEIEEARFMRQTQMWRREDAAQITVEDPLAWLAEEASAALEEPVALLEVRRRLADLPALDIQADGGRRVVFSTLEPDVLRRQVSDGRTRGRGTAARLEKFAKDTPLLGRNPKRVKAAQRSLMDDEWFDVKASKVGKAMEIPWGEPERLWVYLVEKGS